MTNTDVNEISTQSTETNAGHKHAKMESKLVTLTPTGQIWHTTKDIRHKDP